MKRFQEYDPEQPYLLPPAPRDWLPEGHLAFFVSDIAEQLDSSAIYGDYRVGESGGRPPFEPLMMVRVWVYAYAVGIRSSRKVQRALIEDVAFRFLSGNQQPKYWALNQFRARHQQALADLFVQSVRLAAEAGLVKLGHIAIDGSKLKANASKSKATSYARMELEERRLREEIEEYLRSCDEVDAREDEEFGPDDDGMSPPEHLRSREDRLAAIKRAKEQLEGEASERAEREQQQRREQAASEGRKVFPRSNPSEARPAVREQRNFTDPDSRMMMSGKTFLQAYNGQIAVDSEYQVIVAAQLSNLSPDALHLPALLDEVHGNTGQHPKEVSGDAGYYSEENVTAIEAAGAIAYLAPGRIKHNQWRTKKAPRGRIPKNLPRKERMSRLLATKRGKARYLLRQITAEPVFGRIKHTRRLDQVFHCGLNKVNNFWRFDCAVHNLLKIYRHAARTEQNAAHA